MLVYDITGFRPSLLIIIYIILTTRSADDTVSKYDSQISTDTKLFGIFLLKYLDVEYIMDFIR